MKFLIILGFAVLWTSILVMIICILGTVIMRKYRTPLSLGFFLGIIFVMVSQMLIVFAIALNYAIISKKYEPSQIAIVIFSLFLSILYVAFGSMLAVFRNDVTQIDKLNSINDSMPPEPA